MSSIDERVVSMKFNNGQFLSGVRGTLDSLRNLKQGLNLDASRKGLDELARSGQNFNLGGLGTAAEGVSAKFIAMATVGITALTRITNSAINTGQRLVSSLTVDPIKLGLQEYETNLNAIQTILANTQSKGSTLEDVNAALGELNTYSDQTIYNFAEMARNIGTFTAAGVDLDTSTNAIKGIANLAAVSGSNSQQASTAMYQLSQALAAGRVSLMDWNSLVNAGMGGQVMQDALKETARAHGVQVDAIIEKNGSFRDSLQDGWITTEIMTDTLSKFTGDLTDEQLKQMGYTEEQIVGIQEMATTAQDAATKVKTASQLIGTLQEGAQSGWAQTWQYIFGDFEQAKAMWTSVNDVLGAMIGGSAEARNAVVKDWNTLGGRDVLLESIATAFHSLMDVIAPIREAMREIFPPVTGQQLYDLTVKLRDFINTLKVSEQTSENLKRTFRGVFAVLDIVRMVVVGLAGVFGDLVGTLFQGAGGVLNFTGNLGDFLVSLRDAIKNGDGLSKFFEGLSRVLTTPIALIRDLAGWITELFNGGTGSEVTEGAFKRLEMRMKPLHSLGNLITERWKAMTAAFQTFWNFIQPLRENIAEFFGGIAEAISGAFMNMDYAAVLDTISVGLLGGLVLAIRNFLKGGIDIGPDGPGFFDSIKDMFGGVTETLGAMQTQLKAGSLAKIAGAIALLAASVLVLSLVDPARLAAALGAITVMFIQLGGSLAMIEAITSGAGFIKLPVLAAGLVILSAAVLMLSFAVKNLSGLDWQELAKGLTGTVVLLAALAGAAKLMSGSNGALVRAGASLILVAIALRILVGAVKDFADMDWAYMARGLSGVAATLLALGLFTRLAAANKGALSSSAGLILLGVALKVVASAVGDFAEMDWSTLARGGAGVAGALLVIAGAMHLMPSNMLAVSAGLLVVSAALLVISNVLQDMSGMTWEEIGRGMTVLAGSLLILAGALYLMSGTMLGAAALLVAAGALAVLTPILLALSALSWDEILRGLTMLAGAFAVLGLAGLALTPVIPSLLLLGVAISLLGGGLLLAGAGILALSVGLTGLSIAAGAGAAAIVAIGAAVIGLIPALMVAVGTGVVGMVNVLVGAAPAFLTAAITLITTLLQAVNTVAPAIIETVTNLVTRMLSAIQTMVPEFVDTAVVIIMALLQAVDIIGPQVIDTLYGLVVALVDTIVAAVPMFTNAGMDIIIGVLEGIADRVGLMVEAGTDIIVNFLEGISEAIPRVIDAAIDVVITFVESLGDGIRENTARMNNAGSDLAMAIIDGMTGGLASGAGRVIGSVRDMANDALDSAKEALGIHSPSKEFEKVGEYVNEGFAKGLRGNKHAVVKAYNEMMTMVGNLANKTKEDARVAAIRLTELQKAREKETQAKKKDEQAIKKLDDAIKKQKDTLKQAQDEGARAKAAQALIKSHRDEADHLKKLADQYDATTAKLQQAEQKLVDIKKTRDDYKASISGQYSDIEDITKDTQLPDFLEKMRTQIAETQLFATRLQKLRTMGLNDVMYKEILAQGLDALPFVDQLLVGGQASIKELNSLSTKIGTTANSLGSSASNSLYQAGVDAAQGLVDGLRKQQGNLRKEMDTLAAAMVAALKRRLQIKSPSRVFAQLGKYTVQGLAKGLGDTAKLAENAAVDVGDGAVAALKRTMSGLGEHMSTDINFSPTIRPVLDLSEIRDGSRLIDGLLTPSGISTATSYGRASDISVEAAAIREALAEVTYADREVNHTEVKFEQHNTSPKSLSNAEIYRQTKNQLSVVRGGLPTS